MSTPINIPLILPWFGDEEIAAARRVFGKGWPEQGPEVAAFETAVATMQQLPHAIAVSSATAGHHLAYLALGIGPGDVVLIPSFAWPSAANMAMRVGAIPFFVDVDPLTANLTAATLQRGLQQIHERGLGRPRAVVVVHQFGLPSPMEPILEVARAAKLLVIEDAACALGGKHNGKPLGHFGCAAVFSFNSRQSVNIGEGGMVLTSDPALADAMRALRNHGQEMREGRHEFTSAGFNYRLTELQAAVGLVQLKRLSGIIEARQSLAALYLAELEDRRGLSLLAPHSEHTWQSFMILLDSTAERDRVQEVCRSSGIETGPGSVAGHLGAVWGRQFVEPEDLCPVATHLATCGLALPLHSRLTDGEIRRVVTALRNALHN